MKKIFSILFLSLFVFNTAFANVYKFERTPGTIAGYDEVHTDSSINTDVLAKGSVHLFYIDNGDGTRTWSQAMFVGRDPKTNTPLFDRFGRSKTVDIDKNTDPTQKPQPPDFDADNTDHDSMSSQKDASAGNSVGQNGGSFGNSLGNGIKAGATAALLHGGAELAYRYFIMSRAERDDLEKLSKEINIKQDEINAIEAANVADINSSFQNIANAFNADASAMFKAPGSFLKQFQSDPYKVKSKDPNFSSELKITRNTLRSIVTFDPTRQTARDIGLAATEVADETFASGDKNSGAQMLEFAKGLADGAVGLDPITGPIRDIYEAVSGKNLITGEELNPYARGFAVFGAVTFGFGSKIGKGLKMISRMADIVKDAEQFEKAAQVVERGIQNGALRAGMNSETLREAERLGSKVVEEVLEKSPKDLEKYADILEKTKNVKIETAEGIFEQEKSLKALEAYKQIQEGDRSVIRMGEYGKQRVNYGADIVEKPSYWTRDFGTKTPQEYMKSAGATGKEVNFVEQGRITDNAEFITRTSPSSLDKTSGMINEGGGIEVVVKQGDVETTFLWDQNGIVK